MKLYLLPLLIILLMPLYSVSATQYHGLVIVRGPLSNSTILCFSNENLTIIFYTEYNCTFTAYNYQIDPYSLNSIQILTQNISTYIIIQDSNTIFYVIKINPYFPTNPIPQKLTPHYMAWYEVLDYYSKEIIITIEIIIIIGLLIFNKWRKYEDRRIKTLIASDPHLEVAD